MKQTEQKERILILNQGDYCYTHAFLSGYFIFRRIIIIIIIITRPSTVSVVGGEHLREKETRNLLQSYLLSVYLTSVHALSERLEVANAQPSDACARRWQLDDVCSSIHPFVTLMGESMGRAVAVVPDVDRSSIVFF